MATAPAVREVVMEVVPLSAVAVASCAPAVLYTVTSVPAASPVRVMVPPRDTIETSCEMNGGRFSLVQTALDSSSDSPGLQSRAVWTERTLH